MTSNRTLYVVAMNHAVKDGSVYLLSSLFPVVLGLFTISLFQVGVLVATGYLVSVICQPIVGRYGENKDPSKLLAVGIALIAVSITSFIYSTGFTTILASVVVLRIGSSFFHPIGMATVSRTYAGARLQHSMGFQSASGNLGVLLVFLTAGTIYTLLGWQLTFILCTTVAVTDVIVTLAALRQHNVPTPEYPTLTKLVEEISPNRFRIPLYFLGIAFVSGGSYAVILNFANIFLGQHQPQLSVSQIDLVVSAFIASAFLGALSAGVWTRYAKTTSSLATSYALSATAIILFAIFPGNLSIATVALLACGFTISATYPLTYTELSNHIMKNPFRTSSSFGALSSAQTIGASVLGLATGLIIPILGTSSPFLTVGIIMILASIATAYWTRQTSHKRTRESLQTFPAIDIR